MGKRLESRNDTQRATVKVKLPGLVLGGLIGLCGGPAMVYGETVAGAPQAETWETLLNEARAQARQCGDDRYDEASPLTWNARLGAAAQAHGKDMAAMSQMRHEGSEGESLGDRLQDAEYEARAWGENVAAGQQDAASVVAAWLESPGHCANLMSAEFSEFGAGVAQDARGKRYWALVLAAPRNRGSGRQPPAQ